MVATNVQCRFVSHLQSQCLCISNHPLPFWHTSHAISTDFLNVYCAVESAELYTLVINTYERHHFLRRSVAHYSRCAEIDVIRVVWGEERAPPTQSQDPKFYSETKEVRHSVPRGEPGSSVLTAGRVLAMAPVTYHGHLRDDVLLTLLLYITVNA